MAQRTSKLKKRLAILLALLMIGCFAMGGFYKYRRFRIHTKCVAWRIEGLAAVAKGDFPTAVNDLRQYLHYVPDDRAALIAYVAARPHVPSDNYVHLSETLGALRYLTSLDPKNVDAWAQLAELYLRLGRFTEAREASATLLRIDEGNTTGLRVSSLAQIQLHQWKDALATLDRLVTRTPKDLWTHMRRLNVMREAGKAREVILKEAERLQNSPDGKLSDGSPDPRFELLRAYSLSLVDVNSDPDPTRGTKTINDWLRAAAARPPPDAQFSLILVDLLNGAHLYDDALAILRKLSAAEGGAPFGELLACRLWETGQWADLTTLVAKLPPETVGKDRLIAMNAMALAHLGKTEGVPRAIEKLQAKKNDPEAAAWAEILRTELRQPGNGPRVTATMCQQVISRNAPDPYIAFFLGDALARLNEPELAINAYELSARGNSTWALPSERLAGLLVDLKQLDKAALAADECVKRSHRADGKLPLSAIVAAIRVRVAKLQGHRERDPHQLLERLNEVQTDIPGEETTLPWQVLLLCRADPADPEKAKAVIKRELASERTPSEALLLRLATVSGSCNLDLERACLDRSEALHGVTPALAMARAVALVASGKPQSEAVALLSAAKAAPHVGENAEWDLNIARAKEAARDPSAKDAWQSLLKQYPDSLPLLGTAINAPSVQRDGVMTRSLIDRLREQAGEESLGWRIATARWAVTFAAEKRSELDAAAKLLNDVLQASSQNVEAHYLLGRCLDLLGDADGALDHVSAASSLDPSNNNLSLYYIRLLQDRGEYDKVREQLAELTRRESVDLPQRRQAAQLLAQTGESERALGLLEQAGPPDALEPDLLLASLYDRQNQYSRAVEVCEKLLKKPDALNIQFAASLFTAHGDLVNADRVLKLLDSTPTTPGTKELIRAEHAASIGDGEHAAQLLREATTAGPKNAATWRALANWYLRTGDPSAAVAVCTAAKSEVGADKGLTAVIHNSDVLTLCASDAAVRPLTAALLELPAQEAGIGEALHLVADSKRGALNDRVFLDKLHAVADRNSLVLPLQLYCIGLFRSKASLENGTFEKGMLDVATSLATRAEHNFRSSADAARAAATVLSDAGQWSEAAAAADDWHARSLGDPLPSELMWATAAFHLDRPADAANRLAPYAAECKLHPDSAIHNEVLSKYAIALCLSKQNLRATELLDPLLRGDSRWRVGWANAVVSNLDTPQASQWLSKVSDLVPGASGDEQLQLAKCWIRIAARADGEKYRPRARQILEQLIKAGSASAEVLATMGSLDEADGDLGSAETAYRRAIERDSKHYGAQNNLAMLLLHRSTGAADLNEAVELARRAAEGMPIGATYDTLARVKEKAQDKEGAIAAMRQSVKLEPRSARRQLNLAEMLFDFKNHDEAKIVVRSLATLPRESFTSADRQRLQELTQKLDAKSVSDASSTN